MSNVTVYSWGGSDGLESSSPYCLKTIAAIRYKRIAFETKLVQMKMPPWARRGTLPVAEIDGTKVEDSTHILRALDEAFPKSSRLYPEDRAARAETVLLEDWADEVLFLDIFHSRWGVAANFMPFFEQIGSFVPAPLRGVVGKQVRKAGLKLLSARGIGYDTDAQRKAHFCSSLDALEERLSRHAFLIGDAPTAADFAVFGNLLIVEGAHLPELWPSLSERKSLLAWLDRMKKASAA